MTDDQTWVPRAEPAVQAPQYQPPTPQHHRRRWPWVAGALVLVVAIGVSVAVTLWPTDVRTATRLCETAVSADLKAPSTARFGGVRTSLVGGGMSVDGWVDSANSFGAPVRSSWDCTALVTPDGQWRAADVRVG